MIAAAKLRGTQLAELRLERAGLVQLPDGRLVLVTFRRLSHRHGHSRHWFWSAIRAIPIDAGRRAAAHPD